MRSLWDRQSVPRKLRGWGAARMGALMLMLILVGCGPSNDAGNQAEEGTDAPVAMTPAPEATAQATGQDTGQSAGQSSGPSDEQTVVIEFWTTDNEAALLAGYTAAAQRFMAQYPNVDLQIVGKDEATAVTELLAAAAENRLPALVRLGVERLPELAAAGLLDEQAATATIRMVGIDDFRVRPLEMVTNQESQQQWAIPFDGWLQAIWYRKDLLDAAGLAAPATWDQINAACDGVTAAGSSQYALALPSDPTQNYAHQVFEQIAISNQAWPLTAEGEVAFTAPEMVEALRFYTALQRCSAPAPLTTLQAADLYLRGEVAMLFYSTYIMDDLVEGVTLADGSVTLPSLPDLAQRTSFAAGMVGPKGAAAYGQVVALALLPGADPLAQEVARFFLTDGYVDVLATSPLGKIPTRQSVTQRWMELSPVFSNYSAPTLGHIANGYDNVQRWVLRPDYDNAERATISAIESNLLIPQAIANILAGEMTPESAAEWLQAETAMLVAAQ